MTRPLIRGLISGGQSGVDRAALDVAARLGIPLGGWCPAGRAAEDGAIAMKYPLRETPSARVAQRTSWNVYDADATLILCDGELTGGTAYTAEVARRVGRPLHVMPLADTELEAARAWLESFRDPPSLNVAGPRESKSPGIEAAAERLLESLLSPVTGADLPPPRTALVTGAAGYLGRHVLDLAPPGWRVIGTVRPGGLGREGATVLDLADRSAVRSTCSELRPDLIVHTAYGQAEPERDILQASRNVAESAAEGGAALVHLSSDMVFDGESAPYDEQAVPAPVHDYGRWKAEAELAVAGMHPQAAIVRASLITSLHPPDPRTEWVLRGLRGEQAAALFVDEIRTPILVHDLARSIWEIALLPAQKRAGMWHLAAPEALSRFGIGLLVAAAHGLDPAALTAATRADAPGPRPRDLRLSTPRADRELMSRPTSLSAEVARILAREPR